MKITKDVRYVGVDDRETDLFEGLYRVPNGVAYNSYILFDEKIAVFDTVDQRFGEQWMFRIAAALSGQTPSYLIIHHVEPDHSANIVRFMQQYPTATLVASEKAFAMIKAFYGSAFEEHRVVVGEGDRLSLGQHELTFFEAPMVHWPEVLVSYESYEKILFSADAFGKFGALDEQQPWEEEARRYYIGIVGKYGAQVQILLSKLASLTVNMICPLHGPVLYEPLDSYLRLYHLWSLYEPEEHAALVAYTSVYGHTAHAVKELASHLQCPTVLCDLARCDMSQAVAQAFRCDTLVLATTTYNGDIFPFMRTFLRWLTTRGFQKRRVGFIENGTWAPNAAATMKRLLENCRDLEYLPQTVTIRSALNTTSYEQLMQLCKEIDEI